MWPVSPPACQPPLLSEGARGDWRAEEIMAHSEFQARTVAVRMCVASFILFFIDLKTTVFWFPESFRFEHHNLF